MLARLCHVLYIADSSQQHFEEKSGSYLADRIDPEMLDPSPKGKAHDQE